MPVHGLKADLELAGLLGSAAVFSFLVEGALLSNVLFSFLLGALFFLIGLHLDLDFESALDHRLDRLTIATTLVFLVTPIIAYSFSIIAIKEVFLVLAASAAAISSPRVWSNLARGDGKLAGVSSSTAFLLSFMLTPIIFFLIYPSADLQILSVNASMFGIPFITGLALRNYENFLIKDMRVHFSKISFWLITVITLVQIEFLYSSGVLDVTKFILAGLMFTVFTLVSSGLGFALSELLGFYQKESIALGFVSGSKNIALAFLLASQVGAEAIALVGLYYFVRQLTCTGILNFTRNTELSRITGQY